MRHRRACHLPAEHLDTLIARREIAGHVNRQVYTRGSRTGTRSIALHQIGIRIDVSARRFAHRGRRVELVEWHQMPVDHRELAGSVATPGSLGHAAHCRRLKRSAEDGLIKLYLLEITEVIPNA